MTNGTQQKHTPAPWIVCKGRALHSKTIESKTYGNDGRPIGEMYGSDKEANAHLIAAAPELLEALELLLNEAIPDGNKYILEMIPEDKQEIYNKCYEAVIKAKGGIE